MWVKLMSEKNNLYTVNGLWNTKKYSGVKKYILIYIYMHSNFFPIYLLLQINSNSVLSPLFMEDTFPLNLKWLTLGVKYLPTENETLGSLNTGPAALGRYKEMEWNL